MRTQPPDPESLAGSLERVERQPNLVTRVERELRLAIADGRFSRGQLPTEIELAEELGVSRETVRRATETLAAEGLLVKYRRKGTFLTNRAQALEPHPSTQWIGFVQADYRLPDGSYESSSRHIGRLLLDGALDAARERELELVVQRASAGQLLTRTARLANAAPLAGFLFASLAEEKLVRKLAGRGVPMALVDHDATLAGVSTFRDDSAGGARIAVEHLMSLGHTRIGLAYWQSVELNPWRLQGYRDTLRNWGLQRRQQWEFMTDLSVQGAAEVIARWLNMHQRPSAIYCFNNSLAVRVIAAARKESILVPEQLSIVGGGGEDIDGLTYHQCDWRRMGHLALDHLADCIAALEPPPTAHTLLEHTLVSGASAGRCAE